MVSRAVSTKMVSTVFALVGGFTIAAAIIVAGLMGRDAESPLAKLPRNHESSAAAGSKGLNQMPTVYCDFYNLMRSATVVSFDFTVDKTDQAQPRFSENYVVEPDGTRIVHDDAKAGYPIWAFSLDEGTPVIKSPDGETQINLYGIKLTVSGVFWIEAGLRSNRYRNLEGKCRQAHLERRQSDDAQKNSVTR